MIANQMIPISLLARSMPNPGNEESRLEVRCHSISLRGHINQFDTTGKMGECILLIMDGKRGEEVECFNVATLGYINETYNVATFQM